MWERKDHAMPPLSLEQFSQHLGFPWVFPASHQAGQWVFGLWVWCPPMHHTLPLSRSLFGCGALNPTRSPAAGSGPWSASRAGVSGGSAQNTLVHVVPAERGAGVHGAVVPSVGTEDALAWWPEHRDGQGKCSWGGAETPTPAR